MQSELKSTIEETKLVQEKYKNIVEQLKKDIAVKQNECDQLRNQVWQMIRSRIESSQRVKNREFCKSVIDHHFKSKLTRLSNM